MRWLIPSLFMWCTQGLSAQESYTLFPTYPAVLDTFFNRYEVASEPYTTRFEKRTTGWFVSVWYADSLVQQMPFWTLSDGTYQPLAPIHLATSGQEMLTVDGYTGGWVASNYRFCPFYGYPDWHLDVIGHYGGRFDLPDSMLYGMARAYASAAAGRIAGGEFVGAGYQWELPDGANSMTPEQLKEYRSLADRCLVYYDTLFQRDPQFKTHVGEVALKRANEYVWYAQQLRLFQNDAAGCGYLPGVQYDPFYTAFARNMLGSCAPDAILFTNGDTDTFPLEYVQWVEDHRTDVTVVNMSMFNLPRYISFFMHRTKHPLPFTLPDSVFARPLTDVAVLPREPMEHVPVERFLDGVERGELNKDYTSQEYLVLPSQRFTLPGPMGADSLQWTVPKHYLTRSGIALYDLLRTNRWQRPVHFAVTTSQDSQMGLQDHFVMEGLTYRLTAEKSPEDATPYDIVDVDRSLDFFLHHFDSSGMGTTTTSKASIVNNYRLQMAKTAGKLAEKGRKQDAERLLDHCVASIPGTVFPMDRVGIPIMEAYITCGAFEKVDDLAITIMKSTLAMDLTVREWGRVPEQEPSDLKERVAQRLLFTLAREERHRAHKEVKRLAREAGLDV